jgi:ribosomal protein RSM22 (predicted rRNA methylase)
MSPPLKRTGHVIVDVCSVDGDIQRHIASKKDGKEVYTSVRYP